MTADEKYDYASMLAGLGVGITLLGLIAPAAGAPLWVTAVIVLPGAAMAAAGTYFIGRLADEERT